jgi:hypothetical protein
MFLVALKRESAKGGVELVVSQAEALLSVHAPAHVEAGIAQVIRGSSGTRWLQIINKHSARLLNRSLHSYCSVASFNDL